ncbi:M10 family metallopeptidase C-terminal domain-containing protein [Arsenophonus nasoniae]|uniref:Alkaline metalloprotease n=1 Tax=Arsenophonus nasoniae TaxID=638 RepID=D2TWN0_9GAMM|nr:M10 family metallopeptidase C-terminal domain-containing protein [Arsenophonus nasoniae]QBY45194.1 Serralysin A [Arsenophonus nasoniae]WGM01199.1 M10 family metallopeptidase C-terminal domain-containing protein [Arsenophonus nasoniae]WGM05383.1 M10 family metallopeptidase C-terminal domain-containing protein [Arsenophonus nasoniae]WGM10391.1 M10 family metallopeptidase C-terminal domain-containing protein [Arsenophonus nasoniae]WGM15103.1 M10 family metallopeptidase C-terminal domain-contai
MTFNSKNSDTNTPISQSYGKKEYKTLGGDGNDILCGREEEINYLSGGKGDDTIYGGNKFDVIAGGDGNDKIYSYGGKDTLIGGKGKDLFIYQSINDSLYSSPDTIMDFETGRDKIDISALSKINGNTIEIKQVNCFSQHKNELIVHCNYNESQNLTSSYLMLDHDGDGQADFQINAFGIINPETDLILF